MTAMARSRDHTTSTRQWLTGLVLMVAPIVSVVGFSHVSTGWTLGIASAVLIGLVSFFWVVGAGKRGR